jgi:hypothetical protein
VSDPAPKIERGPGVYENLPAEIYHADTAAFSNSMLKILAQGSPAHLLVHIDGRIKNDPTPAMVRGSRLHSAILEPHKITFAVIPDTIERKAGPDWKKFQEEALKVGAEIVTADEKAKIDGMREALMSAKMALPNGERVRFGDILSLSKTEVSAYGLDADTGLMLRARIDILTPDGTSFISDIKTCAAGVGSPGRFGKQISDFGYHIAAHHYVKTCQAAGLDKQTMIFTACESEPPFCVSWHRISAHALEVAAREHARMLRTIAGCIEIGEWPGYSDNLNTQNLPRWYREHGAEDIL